MRGADSEQDINKLRPFFAVLFHSLVSDFCLIYCDLKFSLYKWGENKMMPNGGTQTIVTKKYFLHVNNFRQANILDFHEYAVRLIVW